MVEHFPRMHEVMYLTPSIERRNHKTDLYKKEVVLPLEVLLLWFHVTCASVDGREEGGYVSA